MSVASEQVARLPVSRYHDALAEIDREWEGEKRKFMVHNRNGRLYLPTVSQGVVGVIVHIGVGAFWLGIAAFGMSLAPMLLRLLFAIGGSTFAVVGIYDSIRAINRAVTHRRAFATYQARRAAVKPEDFC